MLIHLTHRSENLTAILDQGRVLGRSAFGAAFNINSLNSSQAVACFSEMAALDTVGVLADRHGQFGVGFAKRWMKVQGAAPVWYLPRDSLVQTEFFNTVRGLAFPSLTEPRHPLWRITPFIDYPEEVEPGETPSTYDWRWEREWRIRGDLEFQPEDVAILFAPEDRHGWLTDWWKDNAIEGWGGLMPPLLDTHWPRERQEEVVRQGPLVVEVEAPIPQEHWEKAVDTAPHVGVEVDRDDEDSHRREELREELSGWLDEMARDDI